MNNKGSYLNDFHSYVNILKSNNSKVLTEPFFVFRLGDLSLV